MTNLENLIWDSHIKKEIDAIVKKNSCIAAISQLFPGALVVHGVQYNAETQNIEVIIPSYMQSRLGEVEEYTGKYCKQNEVLLDQKRKLIVLEQYLPTLRQKLEILEEQHRIASVTNQQESQKVLLAKNNLDEQYRKIDQQRAKIQSSESDLSIYTCKLEELLAPPENIDFTTILIPYTPPTQRIIDADEKKLDDTTNCDTKKPNRQTDTLNLIAIATLLAVVDAGLYYPIGNQVHTNHSTTAQTQTNNLPTTSVSKKATSRKDTPSLTNTSDDITYLPEYIGPRNNIPIELPSDDFKMLTIEAKKIPSQMCKEGILYNFPIAGMKFVPNEYLTNGEPCIVYNRTNPNPLVTVQESVTINKYTLGVNIIKNAHITFQFTPEFYKIYSGFAVPIFSEQMTSKSADLEVIVADSLNKGRLQRAHKVGPSQIEGFTDYRLCFPNGDEIIPVHHKIISYGGSITLTILGAGKTDTEKIIFGPNGNTFINKEVPYSINSK